MKKLRKRGEYNAYKFKILNLLKERGPLRPYELERSLNIPHSSLMNCLSGLKGKWIRKLKDGRYCLLSYEPLEEDVVKVIDKWKEEFKDKPYIRPLEIEEIMYSVGEDPEDKQQRNKVIKIAIKHGWSPFQKELLKHSKTDLREALEKWLKHLEERTKVVDGPLEDLCGLGKLDFSHEVRVYPPKEPSTKNFNLLKQHLEIGGQGILDKWYQLFKHANKFLNSAKGLVEKIVRSTKRKAKKLKLPLNGKAKERIFVNNCVPLIYRSLRVPLDPRKVIKVVKKGDHYVVEPEQLCITYKLNKAENFAKFIRRKITSKKNREEMSNISEKRKTLEKEIGEFKKFLQELIGKIDDGFYLKGWCEKCKHLQRLEEVSC